MVTACIKYFIVVQSVCALLQQRPADGGQQHRPASLFSMAVRKLEAVTGVDIDRDGWVEGKAKPEKVERTEYQKTEENHTKSIEAESREAFWQDVKAGLKPAPRKKKEAEQPNVTLKEEQQHKLPDVSEMLSKPKHAFEALNLQVNSLEASLSKFQGEGIAAIKARKAEYDTTLEILRHNNTALARKNKDASARISALNMSNEDLRWRAQSLTKQCSILTADLKVLQANISNAHEFIENALRASAEKLSTAPQLSVLKELALKDAEMLHSRDHENRLNQIKAAMLQLGASASTEAGVDFDAGTILQSLNSELDKLANAQNASMAYLKDAFEKEFQAGKQLHNKLLAEESKLNATETAALELKGRLTAAVKHLEQTREELRQKSQSLRNYVQRVGSIALPE